MVGGLRDVQDRASGAVAEAATQAAKETVKATIRAVASSVWDLIRRR
jgi:hypothetical protein